MKRKPSNLGNHELIGLDVRAFRAGHNQSSEYAGRIIDETMNTFVLDTGNKEIRVPKHGFEFHFDLDDTLVRINGDRIRFRPEDRTKKVKRVM